MFCLYCDSIRLYWGSASDVFYENCRTMLLNPSMAPKGAVIKPKMLRRLWTEFKIGMAAIYQIRYRLCIVITMTDFYVRVLARVSSLSTMRPNLEQVELSTLEGV